MRTSQVHRRIFSLLIIGAFSSAFVHVVSCNETSTASNDFQTYHNYKLIRFVPENEDQIRTLNLINDTKGEVDFWIRPSNPGKPVEILVSPTSHELVDRFMEGRGGNKSEVIIDDLQKLLDEETPIQSRASLKQGGSQTLSPNVFFSDFQRLRSIFQFMDSLVAQYPRLAQTETIGKSFEGRDLRMIKIGSKSSTRQSSSSKPIMWIDAGIHAREWAAPPTALFIAYSLLNEYDKDPKVKQLVDNFEWHILPSANPDGYEFTFNGDRMWRKTRSRNSNSKCRGVDPNRNWSFHWRESGASSSPCAETYAGPKAFSEAETSAIASHIWNRRQNVKMYLSLHAFSQLWLTPWGFTSSLPANYNDMATKARAAADATARVYGTRYTVGSSTRVLYAAAGGSDDWAHGVAGIPYAYTIELRPGQNSWRGFLLPRNEIRPTGIEIWTGIRQLASDILNDMKRSNRRH